MKTLHLVFACLFLTVISCRKPVEEPVRCIDKSKIVERPDCPKIYKPVCGCDNVTYDNSCFAKSSGVLKWTEGPCKRGK